MSHCRDDTGVSVNARVALLLCPQQLGELHRRMRQPNFPQKRHANWNELTDHEQRALFDKAFEEVIDGLVVDGIFRCVGFTSSGRKVYRITKAGRSC